MAVKFSPLGNFQRYLPSGAPAVGYKLFTYASGSSTKQTTYTTSAGNVAQTNPVILDANGDPTGGDIWLTTNQTYKFVLAPSTDTDPPTSPIRTWDGITGVNDTSVTADEWSDSGLTPTYVSTTSYTVPGDQTSALHVGRRQKFTVTAGAVYGRITASAYASLTTVTVQMDGSQTLDSGLSAVSNAILRANVLSSPVRAGTAAGTDTYTVSLGLARYVKDDEYKVNFTNANALTTSTLNCDSLGAKTIVLPEGTAIYAGAIKGQHTLRYDGTNMVLLNPRYGSIPTIGPGQALTDVSASRSPGVTYTNSTGRTIVVYISYYSSATTNLIARIDGSDISRFDVALNTPVTVFLTVPPGSTYIIAAGSGAITIVYWKEIR